MKYIISIDQSTQGTKVMLFNDRGDLTKRYDKHHRQIVSREGYISHDPNEIYNNLLSLMEQLINENDISAKEIVGVAITNQRETTVMWDKQTGEPVDNAVVWQCNRAEEICNREDIKSKSNIILSHTGLKLSPYFPAAKMRWLLEHNEINRNDILLGTIDTYLIYRLTRGQVYATDYSNASRTQLFNIYELSWDKEIAEIFGIDFNMLPEVRDSNDRFGETDFDGLLEETVPIVCVMGDSHGALFGQKCHDAGMAKVTYGTGSSIMMNIGDKPIRSKNGLVTSIAWAKDGKVEYVLEGNLNYTGAVISWLKDDMKLISSPGDTEDIAKQANQDDCVYLVPAFSGLGAPYWQPEAKASITGMDRTTGRNEIVRAGLESIAYQITDIVKSMEEDTRSKLTHLAVDGGPTRNKYLMQFQSDIFGADVMVATMEELSGIGVAYMAGITTKFYDEKVFDNIKRIRYSRQMEEHRFSRKYQGWLDAVESVSKG